MCGQHFLPCLFSSGTSPVTHHGPAPWHLTFLAICRGMEFYTDMCKCR
jgi:hypothetical protein